MVNTCRGEVAITLNQKSYIMVPSFAVLINIEEELKCSILDLVSKISVGKHLSLKEIEVIIRCSVKDHKIHNITETIYNTGLVKIIPQIMKFIENAIGGRSCHLQKVLILSMSLSLRIRRSYKVSISKSKQH